ncbi:MAG: GIY-YIG nuclease family protein, partial [Bacteroidales bacterium]|nr:GIY-YIG nuclease family protein [Bacteroidales bacterium]MCF8338513.1 GIY-YIG nuclease family protein [Bacteroidales bacterium]
DASSNLAPATSSLIFVGLFLFMDLTFMPMYTVYVLYSPNYDRLYIGFTSDLENRLLSHNSLAKKGFTAKFRPWETIYA